VPDPAARLTELAVRQADEAVAAGLGEHLLEQRPRAGLPLAALRQRVTRRVQTLDEVVAQGLELGHAQNAGTASRRDADIERGQGETGGERLGQLALEAGDLFPQGPTGRRLVDLRRPDGRYELLEHQHHDCRESTPPPGTRRK
jgi:hypothetical protein